MIQRLTARTNRGRLVSALVVAILLGVVIDQSWAGNPISFDSILFFLIYVAGELRMPTGQRPKTPTFNRFGDSLPPRENPGYQETEDEHESSRQ